MTEFAYNNVKNASIDNLLFKLNEGFYFRLIYKKDVKSYLKSKPVDEIAPEIRKMITIYYQNFHYT